MGATRTLIADPVSSSNSAALLGSPSVDAVQQGLGRELRRVHDRLRARVGALESALDVGADDATAFRDSCLAFCRALRRHHVGEDDGAFVVLRRHDPGLGDVLDALVGDHEFLDPLLDRLEVLVAGSPTTGHEVTVERELAGIAAVLENHLAHEERVLVAVLDDLRVEPGSPDDRALRAPLQGILEADSPG